MTIFQKVKIKDIAKINPDSIGRDFKHETIEYIDISSVGIGNLSETHEMNIQNAPSRAKRLVKEGDTIVSTVRPNRRSFFYFKNPKENIVVSTGFAVLRVSKNNDPRYLYYSVTHKSFTDYLTKNAKGTSYPAVDADTIYEGEIFIPKNMADQTLIAFVLSAYDDLIENNQKRIRALEEIAQLLYTEWFVKFKFPGHEKSKMVDSGTKYGMIPEGWKVKKLNDLIKPQYGYTTSSTSNGEYKFLRGMDINKSSFIDWSSVPFCEIEEEEIEKYKINKGDIFIIRMADPGKIGICEQTVPAIFASYLMRLKITSELTSYYLFYFLNSKRYQGFINGTSNGTTRKSINSQQVGMINILVPPIDLLNDFENRAKKIRGFAMELIKKNGCVSLMRDLLIPQLVTGNKVLK